MNILTAVHEAAARLRDATPSDLPNTSATSPSAQSALHLMVMAAEAAEIGETAAVVLLQLGGIDDAPAYLAAADAFAAVREDLVQAPPAAPIDVPRANDGDRAAMTERVAQPDRETLTWDAATTDILVLEAAVADLAAVIITALAATTTRLTNPEHVVALSRAGLGAADAYRALHREHSDVRHLR